VLVPLIVNRPFGERLELMKKVFHIFVSDRVSTAKMTNVVHIISCHENAAKGQEISVAKFGGSKNKGILLL
jgi:hypothetical protein